MSLRAILAQKYYPAEKFAHHGATRMKIYLRFVNPVVAILVLLLCLWAAMNDNGFKPKGLLEGGIPTYFFAKGLFCCSALILLGKLVSLMEHK